MAYYINNVFSVIPLGFFLFIVSRVTFSEAQKVPAIFVFGDSLVDVGNNNYFPTIVRVNYEHNGMDFPTKKPTGRFSNGKISADFLAEKVGLPYFPPYLSLSSMLNKNNPSFLAGISFASGAAGILDITNQGYAISMTKQVEHYSTVYGEVVRQLGAFEAQKHLSKSLFYIVIGGNDIIKYFDRFPITPKPQEFVDSLLLTLKQQLKRLHDYGGRKFVVAGSGPAGCIPLQRHKSKTLECKQDINSVALMFNEGLKSMLQELKSELKDINYSYFDTFNFFLNFIQKPASYGFAEIKVACCGTVDNDLDFKHLCRPTYSFCSNRSDHLFWDPYHPSEAATRIIADYVFEGPLQYSFPFNVEQLIAL